MYKRIAFLYVITFVLSYGLSGQNKTPYSLQAPTGLLCDLLDDHTHGNLNPVTISNRQPAFSWMMEDTIPGINQKAYKLIVSDNIDVINLNQGNIWDTGKVNSSSSVAQIYSGDSLWSNKQYFWKVKYWDNEERESDYSVASSFYTANNLVAHQTARYELLMTEQYPESIYQLNNIISVDFGKAAFGKLQLRLNSKKHGVIKIRLGESLTANGRINRKPTGATRYAEYSLAIVPGKHTYNLKFRPNKRNTGRNAAQIPDAIGVVMPFRYCEIEGLTEAIDKKQIIRIAVNYPFDEEAAHFTCSDTLLNKIWDLCKYSVKATSFAGVYVDGDRERIPYEADALINQLSHYAVDREYSMARYTHEYLITNPTWPTEWILQSVLIAWNDYLYTGDIRSAEFYYKDLVAKTLVGLQDATGLISTKNVNSQVLNDIHFKSNRRLKDIVDWPHPRKLAGSKNEIGETDGFVFTDYNAVSNAYFYKSLVIMHSIATALGNTKDAKMFHSNAKHVKEDYYNLFWDKDNGVYCDGITTRHASLHTNMFALLFGLVKDKDVASVIEFIKSRGMACSVYGSQFLLDALYDNDEDNYALELLTAKKERSWYNMLKVGSTITLEAWDNKFKPNQDWNHVWGASPVNIISRKLMGIEPLNPGWSKFKIEPRPGDLTRAEITVPTIKGTITMSFEQSDKAFIMNTTVPVNTIAQLYLPTNSQKIAKVMLNDKEIKYTVVRGKVYVKNVQSGNNNFVVVYE